MDKDRGLGGSGADKQDKQGQCMNQGPTEAGGRCHIVLMKVIAALLPVVALLAMPASGPGQAVPIRYRTADLACARFRQSVETSLHVESGNRVLRQNSGRSGLLVVTARD
ncbi:MAG TPA: hypothetical protein VLB12_15600, partial [Gemmatimonadales bacterium]|nr:hypothetical protein [Gemmatimonadales bacterium]